MKSIIIHSFMIRELKLKGAELLYFALVYSFSQMSCLYFADDKTTCDFLGISRAQLFRVRGSLLNKGFIEQDLNGFHVSVFCPSDLSDEDFAEMVRIARTRWVD